MSAGTITADHVTVNPTIHVDMSVPDGTYQLVEFRKGHLRLEHDGQVGQLAGRSELEADGLPPVHVLSECWQRPGEVDGLNCRATRSRSEERSGWLTERDDAVLGHEFSSSGARPNADPDDHTDAQEAQA